MLVTTLWINRWFGRFSKLWLSDRRTALPSLFIACFVKSVSINVLFAVISWKLKVVKEIFHVAIVLSFLISRQTVFFSPAHARVLIYGSQVQGAPHLACCVIMPPALCSDISEFNVKDLISCCDPLYSGRGFLYYGISILHFLPHLRHRLQQVAVDKHTVMTIKIIKTILILGVIFVCPRHTAGGDVDYSSVK